MSKATGRCRARSRVQADLGGGAGAVRAGRGGILNDRNDTIRVVVRWWHLGGSAILVGMIRRAPRPDRISTDPAVMLGKPVIHGTRITVEQILRELGAGMATEAILGAHPRLTADDIRAAQIFAAEARRQSRAVATSSHAAEDQAFVDAIAEPWPA